MWNRVVLLAAGVALGWNLVHALVAPFLPGATGMGARGGRWGWG